jgi:predicted acetyltransferase
LAVVSEAGNSDAAASSVRIVAVADDQWEIVAWLWQLFRHDLALTVNGLPYADGRYQTRGLAEHPSPDGAGYIAWRPHPNTGEPSPVGFAVVDGLLGEQRRIAGFWVAPTARRDGIGRALALDVLARHDGPWLIGFQHDNQAAVVFWRRIADQAFGAEHWTETRHSIPNKPEYPADHIIESH